MKAGIKNNEGVKVPTIAEFVTAQSSDMDCGAPFVSIGKLNTGFDVEKTEW